MNPDHLIDKAARILAGTDLENLHPEDVEISLHAARKVIEAVSAEIWDEGWSQGMAYIVGMERGTDDDELDHAITNPYHPEETA